MEGNVRKVTFSRKNEEGRKRESSFYYYRCAQQADTRLTRH